MEATSWARAAQLCCGAGDRTILRDLTFELPQNRITVIMGPGNAGKSTLLRLLASQLADHVAGLWQTGDLTVVEPEVGWLRQYRASDPRPLAPARLQSISRLLEEGASAVLLDEPEVDLTREQEQEVVNQLLQLRGSRTVVLATHNLRFARAIADHAMLLDDGRLVEAGPADVFFHQPTHPRTQYYVRMGS